MTWNDPLPSPPDFDGRREAAKQHYNSLDRRGKMLADLRALADAPGHTANIISAAADEIELLERYLIEACDIALGTELCRSAAERVQELKQRK